MQLRKLCVASLLLQCCSILIRVMTQLREEVHHMPASPVKALSVFCFGCSVQGIPPKTCKHATFFTRFLTLQDISPGPAVWCRLVKEVPCSPTGLVIKGLRFTLPSLILLSSVRLALVDDHCLQLVNGFWQRISLEVVGVIDAHCHFSDKVVPSDFAGTTVVPLMESGNQIWPIICRWEAHRIGQLPQPWHVKVRRTAGKRSVVQERTTQLLLRFLWRFQCLTATSAHAAQGVESLGEAQDGVLPRGRRCNLKGHLLARELHAPAACQAEEGVLVVAAAVALNPLCQLLPIELQESFPDLVHSVL
mmetsp:Transcript_59478/g.138533  ORF Transcript_59478/g.138533 Transcript_59478/m.138533 type:complete len:305 (+) Transcript_59478:191-1105(+)